MAEHKDSFLTKLANVLFAKRHADAQNQMWKLFAYGDPSTHPGDKHLLVHCHMGMSRSTAALATMLAQAEPEADAETIFAHLHGVRGRSWPNSLMIGMADEALGRGGTMVLAMRRLYGRQLVNFPHLGESLRAIGRGAEVDSAIAA